MQIIILGAGQVGVSVAESLVTEANDITLIDTNPDVLDSVRERFELFPFAMTGSELTAFVDKQTEEFRALSKEFELVQ